MKIKLFLIILVIFCSTGCVNLQTLSYDDALNTLTYPKKSPNTHRVGYQYYLPQGLAIEKAEDSYSIITSNDITYYLYVDLISYINNTNITYNVDNSKEYSKKINYNDKFGYIEVNLVKNDKYLIEIMYNYAKIEVMVENRLVNKAIINAISILNSVEYDDLVINNLISEDLLNYNEEVFDLFNKEDVLNDNLDNIEDDSVNDQLTDTDFLN